MDLDGKKIVLGLTGGVACYKAAELCRALVKAGASVQVVMTEAATPFHHAGDDAGAVRQAGLHRPVGCAHSPTTWPHIDLTRDADAILIAPCSADFIAKLAHGACDDLLSTLCLARPAHAAAAGGAGDECRDVAKPGDPAQRRAAARRRHRASSARPPASRPAAKSAWAACSSRTSCSRN